MRPTIPDVVTLATVPSGAPVVEGLVAAAVICLLGYLVSLAAAYGVEVRLARKRHRSHDEDDKADLIAVMYAAMTARLLFSLAGVAAVLSLFGRELGVPCALGIIPLYFVEMIFSVRTLLRRQEHRRSATGSPESESQS